MKLLRKQILVRVEVPEEVVTESGIIIPIKQGREYAGASTFSQTKYAPTHGEVIEAAEGCSAKVGDTVLFHFNTQQNCKNWGAVVGEDLIVDEDKIVAIVRGGDIIPTDGWLIARRAEKAKEKEGSIYIPETHRKESDTKFVVVSIHDGYEDCKVGDVIYTQRECDRPIQANDIFNILPNDLFKIETKDILAVEL